MKPTKYINFPQSYFNTSKSRHAFPEASEMLARDAKSLPLTYAEFILQHPRQNTKSTVKAQFLLPLGQPCVTCNVMVNITIIQQKPQNSFANEFLFYAGCHIQAAISHLTLLCLA